MHYKACEMHPILKPVKVQDNADYCQINRQSSFDENSLCCLRHRGGPTNHSHGGGGAWDMYTRSGVTSFNSCPNPELETVSPLHWHRIRPDLTRSPSHLQQGPSFPCCFPTSEFTWPKWINFLKQPKVFTPAASNRFYMRFEITVPTSPPVPAEHFCVGSLECCFRYTRCNPPTN